MLPRKVPSLKRTFCGKKAFHEKLVLGRSLAFAEDPNDLVLAPFEVVYMFNFIQWTRGKKELIEPLLERVEAKLDILAKNQVLPNEDDKYFDKLAYLIFMKGVFVKLGGNYKKASVLFNEVFEMRDKIENDIHLAAQAAYELGLINRTLQNYELASEWINKAKHDFSGHYSETMINYRSDLALEAIKSCSKSMKTDSTTNSRGSIIGSLLMRRKSGIVER